VAVEVEVEEAGAEERCHGRWCRVQLSMAGWASGS
jgi:hypothetical protein